MSLDRFFERVLSAPAQDVTPARDSTSFVRETFYPARTDLTELLLALRSVRFTGRLMIDLRDGGIATLRVREEVHFDPL